MTPTKEAMEKAREILGSYYWAIPQPVVDKFALEFTKYQKRVEELENLLVRILREEGIEELGKTVAEAKVAVKSHERSERRMKKHRWFDCSVHGWSAIGKPCPECKNGNAPEVCAKHGWAAKGVQCPKCKEGRP